MTFLLEILVTQKVLAVFFILLLCLYIPILFCGGIMSQILFQSPGQQVTLVLETLDGYQRADSPVLPSIVRVFFPTLTLASGYPQNMVRISTGFYVFTFGLPQGATSVGTYVVDVAWQDPHTGNPAQTYYQVVVTAPFGNYSVTAGK